MAHFNSSSGLSTGRRTAHALILTTLTGWLCIGYSQPFVTPPAPPTAVVASPPPCSKDCTYPPSPVDFSPPPVPRFMLERPTRPLSLEEMVDQAKQAQERSRIGTPSEPPNSRP